jgi:sulfur-oxidizing protein SoxY
MSDRRTLEDSARRRFLAGASAAVAGSVLAPLVVVRAARATPDSMAAAIREVIGEASVSKGRVKIDLPPLVENGNTVAMTVSVESPMTEADHVKGIFIFNEKNPQPNIANFHLTPRAGKARVSTRIRLADTQTVVAIAQMSDGSLWSGSVDVVVTIPACLEYE